MALPSSGAISLSEIRDEYNNGSTDPIVFNDYYRGGSFIRANATNNTSTNLSASVPTSANNSPISIEDFLGTERGFKKTYSSNASDQTGAGIFGDDYSVDYPKFIDIDAGTTVFSTSSSTPALDLATGATGSITITNSGNIYGQGGASSSDGGTALKVDVTTTVINNSGANIKGGGGGGGIGGTGGKGVVTTTATASSVTDKTGDKPNFVPYAVDTFFADRYWTGLGGGQFGLSSNSSRIRSSISDKGPVWYRFQINKDAAYTISASINDPFPEDGHRGHRGRPLVNISTAEDTKSQGQGGGDYGSGLSWSLSANLAKNTTYYWCNYTVGPYGYSTPTGNFYYNTMVSQINMSVKVPSTGGTGGAGGVGAGFEQAAAGGSSGASGGSNAGTGGTGGTGGGLGAAGATGATGATGTGTSITYPESAPASGASGSAGGLAGYYILGQSNVTLTDNGTVAGRIA